jgi:hypothetical protein
MKFLLLFLSACGSGHLLNPGTYQAHFVCVKDWVMLPGQTTDGVMTITDDYHITTPNNAATDMVGEDKDGVAVFTQHYVTEHLDVSIKSYLLPLDSGFQGEYWEAVEFGDRLLITNMTLEATPN